MKTNRTHHSEDPNRDLPLCFNWRIDVDELAKLIELPQMRSAQTQRVVASIVVAAIKVAKQHPIRRVSYSRRQTWWSVQGRYIGSDFSYKTVLPSVEALVAAGILIDHRVEKSAKNGSGTQSSFQPAPFLADIKLPKKIPTDLGELIRLKDKAGELAAYQDTERSDRDRVLMKKINAIIAKATIELNAGVVEGDVIRFPKHVVYPDMISLYRVYSGGWTLGGRMYGGWWQQVSGNQRPHFVINGVATVEIDYGQLHPLMLYMLAAPELVGDLYSKNGKVGMEIVGIRDAYEIDGWERKQCKIAFNVLLNAPSFASAFDDCAKSWTTRPLLTVPMASSARNQRKGNRAPSIRRRHATRRTASSRR